MLPKIKRVLDLSQPTYHACPAWPTYGCTVVNYEARHATDGFLAERIEMNAHTGTHVDAPRHFFEEGRAVDQLDPSLLLGRGVPVDLRDTGAQAVDAERLESLGGRLGPGDIALLYTGWAQKRAMTREYLYEWPYLTAQAAQWLVDRGVKGVCTDGLSVGGWPDGTGGPPHRVLLGAGVLIAEELYLDEAIFTEEEWLVAALPVKLKDFGGAPARVLAISFA